MLLKTQNVLKIAEENFGIDFFLHCLRLVVGLPSVSHVFASWRWSFLEDKTFHFEISMTLINVQ